MKQIAATQTSSGAPGVFILDDVGRLFLFAHGEWEQINPPKETQLV